MKHIKTLAVSMLAVSVALTGCASTGINVSDQAKKAGIGAIAGALGGAAISKGTGGEHTKRDAAIGAVLGGAIGAYMGRQAKQIEEQMAGTGVEVELDEETGKINLVMPGNITFANDDSTISPNFYHSLNQLAKTMNQYNQTTIEVAGHTDSNGSDAYNEVLSQRRANAVKQYLVAQGVASSRIDTIGFGEYEPIADNSTEYGRAKNRRVEITINAPEQL